MPDVARSVRGTAIRLSDERWEHVLWGHPELQGWRDNVLRTIEHPARVVVGGDGEHIALSRMRDGKLLAVIYRDLGEDGFVITAFLSRREAQFARRRQLWP